MKNTITKSKWNHKTLKFTTYDKEIKVSKNTTLSFEIEDYKGNRITLDILNQNGEISASFSKVIGDNKKTNYRFSTENLDSYNVHKLGNDIDVYEKK
jgi:hypothetical protein